MLIIENKKRKKLNILNRGNHVQYLEGIIINPCIFFASKNISSPALMKF